MNYIKSIVLLTCLIAFFNVKGQQNKEHKRMYTNKLIHESSPYLLQHAHNPVNWYPWGKEALDKAKKENKLLLISIGYSSCHWCHVMEHESFENVDIAKVMNDNYICIKVDREERPDIDQVYMDAVNLFTGRGGWPLNCIALPNGEPVFGGTYYRPDEWVKVLEGVHRVYLKNPEKLYTVAASVKKGIQARESIIEPSIVLENSMDVFSKPMADWMKGIDLQLGGFDRVPKFPMPITYQFLLDYYHYSNDEKVLDHINKSLIQMYYGGIYDHVGGGFSRYSTDKFWHVPHFEKMLYDNSQLISLYSKAYTLTQKQEYRSVVFDSIDFLNREMSNGEGAFYSSIDADSEKVEGKFYVWDKQEVEEVLKNDAALFCEYYNISAFPNWEEGNILYLKDNKDKLLLKYLINSEDFDLLIKKSKSLLLNRRADRIRPNTDVKVLLSWNAMMIKGFVDSYKAFGRESDLESAVGIYKFINSKMISEHKLYRNYNRNKASINAFLDDYAFYIEALIALYQVSFDIKYLSQAKEILDLVDLNFRDKKSGMFFYTSSSDKALIARKMELYDNVIAASNSVMARNIYKLGVYFTKEEYISRSKQMLANVSANIDESLAYFANWGRLMLWDIYPPFELAIIGNDALISNKDISKQFLPDVLIVGSEKDENLNLLASRYVKNKTYLYLCRDKTCKRPVTSVYGLIELLDKSRKE